jgi:hypothetical protein
MGPAPQRARSRGAGGSAAGCAEELPALALVRWYRVSSCFIELAQRRDGTYRQISYRVKRGHAFPSGSYLNS